MKSEMDELKKEAEQAGFTNLTDEQLAQFAKAKTSAEGLLNGISKDLHMYDEPAHSFRAGEEA